MSLPPVPPKPNRQPWIVFACLAVLLVVGVAVAIAVTSQRDSATAGSGSTPVEEHLFSQPTLAPATEEPTPDPTEAGSPWSPCSDEDCLDLFEDSCDGAYTASQEGKGALIDVFIENKDEIDPARLKDCPQFLDEWKLAKRGFSEGSQEVGTDVKPGTYETTSHLSGGRVSDCYWERSGKNGDIIANNMVTAAKKIRVTIRKSDEFFTSERCGDWMPVS